MPTRSPTEIAREALIQLASERKPPTPEAFRTAYHAIAGLPPEADYPLASALIQILEQRGAGQLDQTRRLDHIRAAIDEQQWDSATEHILDFLAHDAEQRQSGQQWPQLLRDLLKLWDTRLPGINQSHKQETLDRVLANFGKQPGLLHDKLAGLLDNWRTPAGPAELPAGGDFGFDALEPSPSSGVPVPAATAQPGHDGESDHVKWRDTLTDALRYGAAPRLSGYPELSDELRILTEALPSLGGGEDLGQFARRLKRLWVRVELTQEQEDRLTRALTRLLALLLDNLAELAGSDSRLIGQVTAVRDMLDHGQLSMKKARQIESSLKEAIYQQGLLKHSLDEATTSMRAMLDSFIQRVSMLTENTSNYHEKISTYTEQIENCRDAVQLHQVLDGLMADTRSIHTDLAGACDELIAAREQAETAERRIRELEVALDEASQQVKEDQLTGAMNRRGLEEVFARESSRAARLGSALALALIDIDNFKQLNDHYGHRTGDDALRHVVELVRDRLRPTDVVARFGGEEFVVLMPDTTQTEAVDIIERLQRELTRTFFMAQSDRVVITFSAGVAVWHREETELDLLERADQAMYRAKQAGKNRVAIAAPVLSDSADEDLVAG